VPEPLTAYAAEPYSYADVRAIADGLGLSEPVAVTLVRRGYRTPELAGAFLAADESHPPSAFASMADVVARIAAAIEANRRITVHGDFDVDGVCATAIVVSTLRQLGADCDWFIPDRIEDGYGLTASNMERLASRGTSLLVTVDCGIAAVEEIELAKRLGMEVVVTDHHQAGSELPECPILHPEISEYPFTSLCGTAVAWKLACALREGVGFPGPTRKVGPGSPTPEPGAGVDLELVALATVADVVPLVGENRALVKRGLEEMRRTRRPGLRALMAAAKCEPSRLDEGDLAFRLAPRINAAGRLYRADAGVELLLTEDDGRAEQIAAELSRANSERRATEREVDAEAEAALRELPEELREAPGFVLAGEGWHPGVIGIVASRIVEEFGRPTMLIALEGDQGKGSGRSISVFDLHGALTECRDLLQRFGGHRSAAGITIARDRVDEFAARFNAVAASRLTEDDLVPELRVDLELPLAEANDELETLLRYIEPCGVGNPSPLLVSRQLIVASPPRVVGKDGLKVVFSDDQRRLVMVGWGMGPRAKELDVGMRVDVAYRLERDDWNGESRLQGRLADFRT